MEGQQREIIPEVQEIQPTQGIEVTNFTKIAGRLKYFLEEWRTVTDNKIILKHITGYKIPFKQKPYQKHIPLNKVNKNEKRKLSEIIKNLLKKGVVSLSKKSKYDFYSSYFLTPKNDGTQRFILNLKKLNKYLNPPHFKMEDYRTLLKLIYKNCFFTTIDLKDAYYLIPINHHDRKFLKFKFNGKSYVFNSLPFGLSTAPLVFTKILKPVLQYFRERGITLLTFLDDFVLIGCSFEECTKSTHIVVSKLERLGFIINHKKSSLIPSKSCKYLGFLYNSEMMCLSLPPEKKQSILNDLQKISKKNRCKIRKFAMLLGKLIAACPTLTYGWLYTKRLERVKTFELKRNNGDFDAEMIIPNSLQPDFNWWITNIPTAKRNILNDNFEIEIFSDASLTGWGGFCAGEKIHGFWNLVQKKQNIHYLELLAAFNNLKSFCKNKNNDQILLRLDNTTAISYINKMGGTKHRILNDLSREIWKWCEERHIFLFASYINTKSNIEADTESRSLSIETEYEIQNDLFIEICSKLGQPSIDLFATNLNAKCKRYVSWYRDPESVYIDAFTGNWQGEYFYAFPPFSIITKTIHKIIQDKAEGILIVPLWKAQPWFTMFLKILKEPPIIIKPNKFIIFSPFRNPHPLWKKLSLVAGSVSGRHFFSENSPKKVWRQLSTP